MIPCGLLLNHLPLSWRIPLQHHPPGFLLHCTTACIYAPRSDGILSGKHNQSIHFHNSHGETPERAHLAERGGGEVCGVTEECDAAAAVDVAVGWIAVEQRVLRNVLQRRVAQHAHHVVRPAPIRLSQRRQAPAQFLPPV